MLPNTAQDYSYSGIGTAWNATHWANTNQTNQFVSFTNGTSGMQSIPLGIGWAGYQLNANITDLHDQRNWVNDSGMKPATIYRVYNVSQSFHPYRDNRIVGQEVSIMNQSGALYMRAHFVNASFDQYYDYMYVFNDTTQTNRYLILDGIRNDFYSPWTMGNILEVTYDSNNTGHSYGYYIDYYEFVNSSSNWQINNVSWNFNSQNSTFYNPTPIYTKNTFGAGNIGNADAMWVGYYGAWEADNQFQYSGGDFSELGQNLTIPRGRVIDAFVSFNYYVQDGLGINTNYIYLAINGQKVYSKGMGDIINGGTGNNTWHYTGTIDLPLWVNSTNVFNPILSGQHLNISVGFMSGGTIGYTYFQDSFQNIVWFDNITLGIKSETTPDQIGLNLNSTSITTVDWGKGTISIDGGNWNGTMYPFVTANFSCTDAWNLSGYTIDLITDFNLFAQKDMPDSNYETNANSLGTDFTVSNASIVNWACYVYFSVPTGFAETQMTIQFPADVNITWINEPQNPGLNRLSSCNNATRGILMIPVNSISMTPDGFWYIQGVSPNYCTKLTLLENATAGPGGWVLNNSFLSGNYINFTGQINNSQIISAYTSQTSATLVIIFPNGTTWTSLIQVTSPNAQGNVSFAYIQIPNSPPNYVVGVYQAILRWNNSYLTFGANETGILSSTFTVVHNSYLVPDQAAYYNILQGTLINVHVTFSDPVDGTAVQGGQVYVITTVGYQFFSEISPGYYFLQFNTSNIIGGIPGYNNLTVIANSTLYLNNAANITIELTLQTTLNAKEFPSIQVPWNQNFTIHLNYTEKISGASILTTPTTNWIGACQIVQGSPSLYDINMTFNSSAYAANTQSSLVIETNKSGEQDQTIVITVQMVERGTNIGSIALNQTSGTTYSLYWNQNLNVTISYTDTSLGSFILGASVNLTGSGVSSVMVASGNQYATIINTSILGVGTFPLTISAKIMNYSLSQSVILITVLTRPTSISSVALNNIPGPSCTLYWNQTLNVTAWYTDTLLGYSIGGASVLLNGTMIMPPALGTQYTTYVNTTDLGIGTFTLPISAVQTNYTQSQILISVTVITRTTSLSVAMNGTLGTSSTFYWGQVVNVTAWYSDAQFGYFIQSANVRLNGTMTLSANGNQYATLINTTLIGIGSTAMTITAVLPNYTLSQVLISITVLTRTTNLSVTLNGRPGTSCQLSNGQNLTVTAAYQDTDSGTFINGASVNLTGTSFLMVMNQNGSQYTVTFNSTDINAGFTSLTISAILGNYTGSQQVISISIIPRAASIALVALNMTYETSISVYWGQSVNVTAWYVDNDTLGNIANANVTVVGAHFSQVMSFNGSYYTVIIDTTDLGIGFVPLTISALNVNYTSAQELISISVLTRTTNITQVYLNGINGTFFQLNCGKQLIITVWYVDILSGDPLTSAAVTLTGPGISVQMTQSGTNYTYPLDTSLLGVGFATLTIYAIETNYTASQSVISISVLDRVTYITVLINQQDATLDPTIDLPIGSLLTITINYYDSETLGFLENAQVNLAGQALNLTATSSPYTFSLNTNSLGIGVYFLTASAQLQNYQADSLKIRVSVRTIAINVSTESGSPVVNAAPGDSVTLSISITNMDFGGKISNATVSYAYVFGHGQFVFNNGTYVVTLESVQEGTYKVTITVFAGDDYTFEQYEITLNVVKPAANLLTPVLIGVIAVLGIIVTAGLVRAKIIVPRRLRAQNALLEFTSYYYDAHNLVGYVILNKRDGTCLFDQWQDQADRHLSAVLISGFLTAITAFGDEIPDKTRLGDFRKEKGKEQSNDQKTRLMLMDYEDFVILILDGEYCRAATIFATKPTQYFASRLRTFMQEMEETYRAFLVSFSGGTIDVFKDMSKLFEKSIHYSMTRPVELNQSTKAKKLQKDIDLTVEELRMLNVIQSFLREKDYVRLRTVVSLYGTSIKDAEMSAVKGIVGLWFKGLLAPVDPEASLETALRFFSEEDAEILGVIASGVSDSLQVASVTGLTPEGVAAKLQSYRAWKLVNLQDAVTDKGRILLDRRLNKEKEKQE